MRSVVSTGIGLLLLTVAACGSSEPAAPTELVCEVLSWAETQSVTFPLGLASEEVHHDVVVDDTLLIEFGYENEVLWWTAINPFGGERDYITSQDRFSPSARARPEAIGEVVFDSSRNHPGRSLEFRIRCVAA